MRKSFRRGLLIILLLLVGSPAWPQAVQPTVNRPNVQTITIPPAETAGAVQLLDDSGHVIGTSANPINTTGGGGGGGTVTQGTAAAASGAWPVTLAIGGALNAVGNPVFVAPGTGASFAITAASLPLPTGAATSALQSTINTTLGSPFQAGGALGAGSAIVGKVGIDQSTPGTTNAVQPVAGTGGGCTPYHLSGGTTASNNSNSIKSSAAGNLCSITPINTTTTIYYFKIYDSASAPTCSSATNLKHVYPIPPASASGGAGGIVRSLAFGESYANGIGFCVVGGGGDTDNSNAATGVYIEASYK